MGWQHLLCGPCGAHGHAAPWQKVEREKTCSGQLPAPLLGSSCCPHPAPGMWLPELSQGPVGRLLRVPDLAQLLASALCPSCVSFPLNSAHAGRGQGCVFAKESKCTLHLRAPKQVPSWKTRGLHPGSSSNGDSSGSVSGRGGGLWGRQGTGLLFIPPMVCCSRLQD